VFTYLERLAAQGDLIHQDDTSVRILSLMAQNLQIRAPADALGLSRPTERMGMFTTGGCKWAGPPSACMILGGIMPGRISRACYSSARRAWAKR
jgi:hypothetical protein